MKDLRNEITLSYLPHLTTAPSCKLIHTHCVSFHTLLESVQYGFLRIGQGNEIPPHPHCTCIQQTTINGNVRYSVNSIFLHQPISRETVQCHPLLAAVHLVTRFSNRRANWVSSPLKILRINKELYFMLQGFHFLTVPSIDFNITLDPQKDLKAPIWKWSQY